MVYARGNLKYLPADLEAAGEARQFRGFCDGRCQKGSWNQQLARKGVDFCLYMSAGTVRLSEEMVAKLVGNDESAPIGRTGSNFDLGVDETPAERAKALSINDLQAHRFGQAVDRNWRGCDAVVGEQTASRCSRQCQAWPRVMRGDRRRQRADLLLILIGLDQLAFFTFPTFRADRQDRALIGLVIADVAT